MAQHLLERTTLGFLAVFFSFSQPGSGQHLRRASSDLCGASGINGERKVVVDGQLRAYEMFIPPDLPPGTQVPLWLLLGGTGERADKFLSYTGLQAFAKEKKFGYIALQGPCKNAMETDCIHPKIFNLYAGTKPRPEETDDLAYVRATLDVAADLPCVDKQRVHCAGYSNGGRYCIYLASMMSERIASIAVVGALRYPETNYAVRAIPILAFHGTADRVNPWNGHGNPKYWRMPVLEAFRRWGKFNHCRVPDALNWQDFGHHIRATVLSDDCSDGADVELVNIKNGGHSWPGCQYNVGVKWTGYCNEDIDTNHLVHSFFDRHPLPVLPQAAAPPTTAKPEVRAPHVATTHVAVTTPPRTTTQQVTTAAPAAYRGAFTVHEGTQCIGAEALPSTKGSASECKDRCQANAECAGFVHVRSGALTGTCFFRKGPLSVPTPYALDKRDCYVTEAEEAIIQLLVTEEKKLEQTRMEEIKAQQKEAASAQTKNQREKQDSLKKKAKEIRKKKEFWKILDKHTRQEEAKGKASEASHESSAKYVTMAIIGIAIIIPLPVICIALRLLGQKEKVTLDSVKTADGDRDAEQSLLFAEVIHCTGVKGLRTICAPGKETDVDPESVTQCVETSSDLSGISSVPSMDSQAPLMSAPRNVKMLWQIQVIRKERMEKELAAADQDLSETPHRQDSVQMEAVPPIQTGTGKASSSSAPTSREVTPEEEEMEEVEEVEEVEEEAQETTDAAEHFNVTVKMISFKRTRGSNVQGACRSLGDSASKFKTKTVVSEGMKGVFNQKHSMQMHRGDALQFSLISEVGETPGKLERRVQGTAELGFDSWQNGFEGELTMTPSASAKEGPILRIRITVEALSEDQS
eukprot:TRINITY_DN4687_c0_g1_i1.p1 TRINITY_DN4687_c0_g1~~TRINITY_DN4687_c0_g1_i1.p1  ORF type:complete len:863 (-),score=186.39 TRINITY_DN4687_c0_g1_i1:85-2673(-)